MKKLSVFIALALVLTIGGAYATWSFAVGSVTNDTHNFTGTVNMEIVDGNSMGTLAASFATTPGYTVDPKSEDDYTPVLSFAGGDLTITFTAAKDAEPAVKEGAVDVVIKFSSENITPYNSSAVNAISFNGTIEIKQGAWGTGVTQDDDTVLFTKVITDDEILAKIVLDNDEKLTTLAEAQAFQKALGYVDSDEDGKLDKATGTITITVTSNLVDNQFFKVNSNLFGLINR